MKKKRACYLDYCDHAISVYYILLSLWINPPSYIFFIKLISALRNVSKVPQRKLLFNMEIKPPLAWNLTEDLV